MSKQGLKGFNVVIGLLVVAVVILAGLVGYLYGENVRLKAQKTLYVIAMPEAFTTRAPFNYTLVLTNPNDFEVSYFPHLTVTMISDRGKMLAYSRSIEFNMTSPFVLRPHEQRIIYYGTITLSQSIEKGIYWLQATSTSTEDTVVFGQPVAIDVW